MNTNKKKIIFFIFLIFSLSIAKAQKQETLTTKEVLEIFKKNSPIKAIEIIHQTKYIYMDYRALYDNEEIKQNILKALNRKDYFNEKMQEEDQKTIKLLEDKAFFDSEIASYLKKNNTYNDSILFKNL